MSQKSYNNTPSLYIVPTPIGNMEDITYRAINVLNEVDIIFSEDTRVTSNLLNYYNIKKKLVSSHKFNEDVSSEKLIEFLKLGKNVALVSDRGTPILSDPGNICVKKAIENGFNVISLPGATAAIPALTSSGLDSSKFIFYGFLSNKKQKRLEELNRLKLINMTIIIYEAPHRIINTLNDILFVFGDTKISVSREISKKFEEIYRGNAKDILSDIQNPKGEYVIVISKSENTNEIYNISIKDQYNNYLNQGIDEKTAIKMIAKERKVPKNEIYKEVKLFPGK